MDAKNTPEREYPDVLNVLRRISLALVEFTTVDDARVRLTAVLTATPPDASANEPAVGVVVARWAALTPVDALDGVPDPADKVLGDFGSDKPDTRFVLEINNLSDLLPGVRRRLPPGVPGARAAGGHGAHPPIATPPRRAQRGHLLRSQERVTVREASCADWPMSSALAARVAPRLSPRTGDDVWLSAPPRHPACGSTTLVRARVQLCELALARGDVVAPVEPHFLWDKERLAHGRWSSSRPPFTAAMWEDVGALYSGDMVGMRGQHRDYDLVLNGVEIGGDSVRVHDAAMQDLIFSHVLQLDVAEKVPLVQRVARRRTAASR
ncbi:hypothetical protein HYPSUDRAFT_205482 [Hypholoma sublateritium FD-334 SS-4]|uniref:Aminoacyl-tRNA synthetase class II (D/K/N) domain-containing protein n=1 Tax=Hypholoma sublateritium (strain FD-334 SS-4) TaxID=945553 RepID=A0A0D2NHC9_HYPSF|nr:hypothetical protein HYPSUDRAFT_205482 [Hypholoma sublateritium FD-334 SS-4]